MKAIIISDKDAIALVEQLEIEFMRRTNKLSGPARDAGQEQIVNELVRKYKRTLLATALGWRREPP